MARSSDSVTRRMIFGIIDALPRDPSLIPMRPGDMIIQGRREAIAARLCASCRKPADYFVDIESAREYTLSGLCQPCQDEYFADPEAGEE